MIGTELLDDPRADPVAVEHQLRDIALLNRLFGGTKAVLDALEPIFKRGTGGTWTLLDVGTGLGDIPRAAVALARRYGITLRPIGVEVNRAAAIAARGSNAVSGLGMILADGGTLPIRAGSVDIVIASQVLHHLPRGLAVQWIAKFGALARRAVVLADLRRSRLAMTALWLASFPLGFDAVTRHDGVLSLRRGYTVREFNALLRDAGVPPVARRRPGFRIVAAWELPDVRGQTSELTSDV